MKGIITCQGNSCFLYISSMLKIYVEWAGSRAKVPILAVQIKDEIFYVHGREVFPTQIDHVLCRLSIINLTVLQNVRITFICEILRTLRCFKFLEDIAVLSRKMRRLLTVRQLYLSRILKPF